MQNAPDASPATHRGINPYRLFLDPLNARNATSPELCIKSKIFTMGSIEWPGEFVGATPLHVGPSYLNAVLVVASSRSAIVAHINRNDTDNRSHVRRCVEIVVDQMVAFDMEGYEQRAFLWVPSEVAQSHTEPPILRQHEKAIVDCFEALSHVPVKARAYPPNLQGENVPGPSLSHTALWVHKLGKTTEMVVWANGAPFFIASIRD